MWPDTQVNVFLEKILDAAGSGGGAQLQVLAAMTFFPLLFLPIWVRSELQESSCKKISTKCQTEKHI